MLLTRIKGLKLQILLFTYLASLFFCSSILSQRNTLDNYLFVTTSKYFSSQKAKKCITIPYDIKRGSIINQVESFDSILSCAISLCEASKCEALMKYIKNAKNINTDTTAFNELLIGIYYFFLDDYSSAIGRLKKYKGVKYNFLQYLLIADSEYELLEDSNDWPEVIGDYQKAYDATDVFENKKLIEKRILYIRYQK